MAALNTPLSPQESRVSILLAEGLSNAEIGKRLNLTQGSVKEYLSRAFRKSGVSNRTALAIWVLSLKAGLIAAALLIASAAHAATTVAQTIVGPDGAVASGTVLIRINTPCASTTSYVGKVTTSVRFTAGVFSVALVPNDTCLPAGTSYTVSWALTSGQSWNEVWIVPTSVMPVTVDSVKVEVPPTPALTLLPSQIRAGGATVGQCLVWSGTAWIPGSCGRITWSGVSGTWGEQGFITWGTI